MKLYYFLIILSFLSACSKNEDAIDDASPPAISPLTPSDNQVFDPGQAINIRMQVKDDSKIFLVHVHISDKNTGQLLLDIHRYPDNPLYDLNESFTAKAGIGYKIQVIGRDIRGNESNLTVFVTTN
jgi:hypothetical protein